jgi:uncharacterized protein
MPAGAVSLDDITSADWSLALDSSQPSGIGNVVQGVADINQCIGIILATPKGSDPLRPNFAADLWRWIDAPVNVARPNLVREIVEGLTIWEPRIRVLSVVISSLFLNPSLPQQSGRGGLSDFGLSQLSIAITWQLKVDVSGVGNQQLTLTVPRSLG